MKNLSLALKAGDLGVQLATSSFKICILTYIITLLSLTLLISRIIILTLLYTCIDIVTYIHMY